MDVQIESEMRRVFSALRPGDKVEIEHEVKVGMTRWPAKTVGTVVRTDRRRHGMHFLRNPDDKVWSDIIVMTRSDGELTTITVDEFTKLRLVESE